MATKKKAVKKAAPKKAAPAKAKKPVGVCAEIIALFKKGKTQKQIVEMGFNKSTVYRQTLLSKTNK